MFNRLLVTICLLLPLTAGAVYFPGGIDWTNPSQSRFTESLYLNMLGRAPADRESRDAVSTLRRNDNRIARLRLFESIVQSPEYRRSFNETSSTWQVFRAPDYNYNNGSGFYRYQAAQSVPAGFTNIPDGRRLFTKSVAQSVAHYYNAFCYRGNPCIDNPELARDRGVSDFAPTISSNAHACAEQSKLTSQFKWVAIKGTTYPRGIGRDTICLEDGYFKADQLTLHDNSTGNTDAATGRETDSRPTGIAHACADPAQTTSVFTWQRSGRTTQSKGIGTKIICMDNFYYSVGRMTLSRFNCNRGYTNCRPDPANNLTAERHTRVNGKTGFQFANDTSVTLTARGKAPQRTTSTTTQPIQVEKRRCFQLARRRCRQTNLS